ncbi:MAG: M20/M25/M40 family metallo-hydrolase [Candidatus Thorarchaeota archaeon]
MTAYDYVKILSVDIGPRPSGSENCKQTAEFLERELQNIGIDEVTTKEFKLRPDFWNGTAILAISFGIAILFSLEYFPILALILSVVLPILTLLEVDNGIEVSMKVFPSGIGRNVIGKEMPTSEATKRIIVCAHHDSKTQAIPIRIRGLVIRLVLISMIYLFTISLMKVLSSTILPQLVDFTSLLNFGLFLVIPFLFIYTFLNFATRFVAQSPGADDNASSVGVALEVAKKLKELPLSTTEVWFLLTDGEEIAMKGAIEFVKTHHDILAESIIINIEGCGVDAPLAFSTKEMSMRTAESSTMVTDLFQKVANEIGEDVIPIEQATTTDGYQFARHGYDVSTIWRFSNEVRDATHTSRDSIDRMNSTALDNTVYFVEACLREFDRK